MGPLKGKVAVVAGATRGAGRGIACMLGEAGATVYCTGRSVRGQLSPLGRPETIEETAERVTAAGGTGIWVQCDHSDERQVQALFERVQEEQDGRLDILVNDIWGGESLTEWKKPFWEQSLETGLKLLQQAIHTHLITSHYGVPLMVARKQGLVVEVTDGTDYHYRGSLYYSLVKVSVIHLAAGMAADLKDHNVAAVAMTPGYLRSEEMLDGFGVTEANWRDGAKKDPDFLELETPAYVGRAVAALAADSRVMEKSGKALSSWDLAEEFGFTDIDGRTPNIGRYFAEKYGSATVIT
jgi:NAD(P)-dependent dehydrogenase (short-subunit alcohol dehydrogenase family)